MVVCEFEEHFDDFYLKDLRAARSLPDLPVPSMGFESSPEELKKSTTSASKSLPAFVEQCSTGSMPRKMDVLTQRFSTLGPAKTCFGVSQGFTTLLPVFPSKLESCTKSAASVFFTTEAQRLRD
ncbi:hypothetical protein BDZ45DRAFT_167668 [Acephala macrosclerotiorum]|nr:hypothetical protein BDZ45DRAFT_167668 [Acephala macrosclerotiorum]